MVNIRCHIWFTSECYGNQTKLNQSSKLPVRIKMEKIRTAGTYNGCLYPHIYFFFPVRRQLTRIRNGSESERWKSHYVKQKRGGGCRGWGGSDICTYEKGGDCAYKSCTRHTTSGDRVLCELSPNDFFFPTGLMKRVSRRLLIF